MKVTAFAKMKNCYNGSSRKFAWSIFSFLLNVYLRITLFFTPFLSFLMKTLIHSSSASNIYLTSYENQSASFITLHEKYPMHKNNNRQPVLREWGPQFSRLTFLASLSHKKFTQELIAWEKEQKTEEVKELEDCKKNLIGEAGIMDGWQWTN
jgi:hypothetical protein